MADIIWAELRVQTDKSKKEVQSLNKDIATTGKVAKKSGDEATKAYNQQAVAANKAAGSQNAIQKGIGGINKGLSTLTSSLGQVAAGMGVAFGTQQVIQFAKASVEAFVEAEKNSQLLLFSLKGNAAAQQQLIDQAKRLQNTTVFDDDSIIQAQTFLATQGRTPAQIQKVIDAAVQLSTVLGTDLQTSVMQLDGTFEGNAGRLRKLDADFKELTEEQLRNGAAVDLVIEKYKGQAEAMGETSAGQMQKLKNQYGELQESIGEQLLPSLNGLMSGLDAFSKANFSGGIDGLTKAMEFGVPQIQEFREAFAAFAKGDFWGGLANVGEGVLSTLTFGMYTRVKNYFTPAKDEYIDGLTAMDKKQFEIIASTEAQIKAERDRLEAMGGSTKAFDEFVTKVRTAELENIFNGLNQSLDITRKQFERLTSITDRYGISTMVASDAILRLKAANGSDLQKTFENMHTRLGVSKKDWDEYLGVLEEIPPKHEEVEGTLKQLPGPYEQLTNAVSKSTKALQDLAALALRSSASLNGIQNSVKNLNEDAFRLVLTNNLITASMGDLSKELEDMSRFMDSKGQFLFNIPGGDEELQKIKELLTLFKERQAFLKESQAHDDELKKQHLANLDEIERKRQEAFELERQLAEERQIYFERADEILTQLGVRRIDEEEEMLKQLQTLRDKDIISLQEYSEAAFQIELNRFSKMADSISGLVGSFNGMFTKIFGDAGKKADEFLALQQEALEKGDKELAEFYGKQAAQAEAFANFQKSLTIIEIAIAQAGAIAKAISAIASGDPTQIIGGVAALIAAIGTLFAGLMGQIESVQVPNAPQFAKGTGYVTRGNNPRGVDTVPAWLTEGEGVVTVKANASYPGLVDALNMGKGDEYIMKHFIEPVLRAEEKSTAENLMNSMMLQKGKAFDDFRMLRELRSGNMINKSGFDELINELKRKNKKRGGYA